MARRLSEHSNSSNNERWIISYADFITLLFAFFVVMYAISTVNLDKYHNISQVLEQVFKDDVNRPIPEGESQSLTGVTSGELLSSEEGEVVSNNPEAQAQENHIHPFEEQLSIQLDDYIINDDIKVSKEDGWIRIELGSHLLFESGSLEPADLADDVLDKIGTILKDHRLPILVEGHTDDRPLTGNFLASNWELSAVRAATIIRTLIWLGVSPKNLSAVGYGEQKPIYSNLTPEGRSKNRRVVLNIATEEAFNKDLSAVNSRLSAAELNALKTNRHKLDTVENQTPVIEQTNTEQGGMLFKQAEQDSNLNVQDQ